MDWTSHFERERARFEDGERRLPDDPDERQRQLTRLGNAANGAALCLLMTGRGDEARGWFLRAAERWRESSAHAPPGSWGRPIGAIKARLLAGDSPGAEADARWALELGAEDASSPIGRYAACLALLVLGEDREARHVAATIREREDFPGPVADSLATIAAGDRIGYWDAIDRVVDSFEHRDEYLEDVPVADTVLVLQRLAEPRGLAAELDSELLPPAL